MWLDLLKRVCFNPEHPQLKALNADLIIKNDRLLRAVANLTAKLAEANKPPTAPKPVAELLKVTRAEFTAKLAPYNIKPISEDTPLDTDLYITSLAELERIAPDICYPADYYIAETWDCENYAMQAVSDAARLFHVNGICLALGMTPLGYHGYCVTFDKDWNIWFLEPNSGFDYSGGWVKQEEVDYKTDKVLV